MKLSWKIVLVVLLIVTLTVSVSSYVMIAAAFQAELDSQASAAADESQLLCLTLGALASQTAGSMEGALLEQLESNGLTQRYRMMVYRQDGGVLWQNREEPGQSHPPQMWGRRGLCYGFFQKAPGDSRYLETIQRLELNGESFYVDLLQEANRAFTQRDANLRVYRQVIFAVHCRLYPGFHCLRDGVDGTHSQAIPLHPVYGQRSVLLPGEGPFPGRAGRSGRGF